MKVAIRADASVAIGTGHVWRCLALACALRDVGATVLFVSREHHGSLIDHISEQGFRVAQLPRSSSVGARDGVATPRPQHADWLGASWEEDAASTVRAIDDWGRVDWLIVDHYALDVRWEARVRPATRRLMVIDDLADRHHDCDLVLDPNYYKDLASRYDRWVPAGCTKLLGPRYALMRDEFRAARTRVRRSVREVRRIHVFLGGADPENETGKVLDALTALSLTGVDADVVVAESNPHRPEIDRMCSRQPYLHCRYRPSSMADLMVAADLAIGGCGASALERCCLELPAIAIAIAHHQEQAGKDLHEAGAHCYIGARGEVSVDRLCRAILALIDSPSRLRDMGRRAGALFGQEGEWATGTVARYLVNGP